MPAISRRASKLFDEKARSSLFGDTEEKLNQSVTDTQVSGGVIIHFPEPHARAPSAYCSAGQRSGRSSLRDTPVSRSIGKTNSAGTPRLDFVSQYQICDCVVPIRSAKGFCPPATAQARLSASFDMNPTYPFFRKYQPRNLWATTNLKIGRFVLMDNVDPKAVGRRLRARRTKLGLSTTKVGESLRRRKLRGYSQQNIVSLEKGDIKDPRRQAMDLAEPLETTPDWLLYGRGPEEAGPRVMTRDEYDALPRDLKAKLTDIAKRHGLQKSA
jgi:transcriptional regulator with XRE-family HTH domain